MWIWGANHNNNQTGEAESIVKDFPNIDFLSSQDVGRSSWLSEIRN